MLSVFHIPRRHPRQTQRHGHARLAFQFQSGNDPSDKLVTDTIVIEHHVKYGCFAGAVRIFTPAGLSSPTSTLSMAIPGITHNPNKQMGWFSDW